MNTQAFQLGFKEQFEKRAGFSPTPFYLEQEALETPSEELEDRLEVGRLRHALTEAGWGGLRGGILGGLLGGGIGLATGNPEALPAGVVGVGGALALKNLIRGALEYSDFQEAAREELRRRAAGVETERKPVGIYT